MAQIGEIRNEENFKQPLLFTGIIRHRGISPTDIDMCIEYNGNAILLFEFKHYKSELTTGQRLLLERLVDCYQSENKIAAAILVYHYNDAIEPIIAKNQFIDSVYTNGKWTKYNNLTTVEEIIEKFENKCIQNHIKI